MKSTYKAFAQTGILFALLAVIFGAFGAHTIKDLISEKDLQVFETGVKYQFYHALAIIIFSLSYRKLNQRYLTFALFLMALGIIIFSGSLYALATRTLWGDNSNKIIGAITPLGGVSFILGWLLILFKGFDSDDYEFNQQVNDIKHESRRHHAGEHRSRHHRYKSQNKIDSNIKD